MNGPTPVGYAGLRRATTSPNGWARAEIARAAALEPTSASHFDRHGVCSLSRERVTPDWPERGAKNPMSEREIMSTQKLIHRSLVFAFTLTLAGAASARRPPALAEAQDQADRVFGTCPHSRDQGAAGYRDRFARVQTTSPVTRAIAAGPARKMGDHFVIVCAGGEVHHGSGYRDFPVRFPAEPTEPLIARVPGLVGHR